VRATAIVLKAYQAGTLPPAVVAINSLSGKPKLPDLAELKEVLNMQHLVRCIEYIYFNAQYYKHYETNLFPSMKYAKYPAARRRFPDCLKENIPGTENATIDSFRGGFFRAIYRLLLAGAVLARAYMAPVFQAREEGNARFFRVWGHDYYWSEDMDQLDDPDPYPKEADYAYIRQYPAYNFDVLDWSKIGQWRNREYETCFGPFASWIIEDGRMREQNKPRDLNDTKPDWAENRVDVGAVRELMLLLVAYDHFNDCFQHYDGISHSYLQKQGNRTVSIVRFGFFKVEEITMPAAAKDLTDTALFTKYHPALEGTVGKDIKDQIDNFGVMWELQRRMRNDIPWHEEYKGPPATLELWQFALRHYLNLTFKPGTFWMPRDCDCVWWREVGRGEIFINPNWNVVQKYKPGVITWDYRNN
jgi:hypothetical protein